MSEQPPVRKVIPATSGKGVTPVDLFETSEGKYIYEKLNRLINDEEYQKKDREERLKALDIYLEENNKADEERNKK